jgi:hypothetical protein
MFKLGELEDLPIEGKKKVGAKVKYPWEHIQPGQWFQFPDSILPQSAKTMACQYARIMSMKFRVFRGTDDRMYCQRVDGLRIREKDLPKKANELPLAKGGTYKDANKMPKPMFDDEVLVTDGNEVKPYYLPVEG